MTGLSSLLLEDKLLGALELAGDLSTSFFFGSIYKSTI